MRDELGYFTIFSIVCILLAVLFFIFTLNLDTDTLHTSTVFPGVSSDYVYNLVDNKDIDTLNKHLRKRDFKLGYTNINTNEVSPNSEVPLMTLENIQLRVKYGDGLDTKFAKELKPYHRIKLSLDDTHFDSDRFIITYKVSDFYKVSSNSLTYYLRYMAVIPGILLALLGLFCIFSVIGTIIKIGFELLIDFIKSLIFNDSDKNDETNLIRKL